MKILELEGRLPASDEGAWRPQQSLPSHVTGTWFWYMMLSMRETLPHSSSLTYLSQADVISQVSSWLRSQSQETSIFCGSTDLKILPSFSLLLVVALESWQ